MERHGTTRRIRGSVHQNITRQGSQTITEPSIMCPLSVVGLASPILIVGAHRAARYIQSHAEPISLNHASTHSNQRTTSRWLGFWPGTGTRRKGYPSNCPNWTRSRSPMDRFCNRLWLELYWRHKEATGLRHTIPVAHVEGPLWRLHCNIQALCQTSRIRSYTSGNHTAIRYGHRKQTPGCHTPSRYPAGYYRRVYHSSTIRDTEVLEPASHQVPRSCQVLVDQRSPTGTWLTRDLSIGMTNLSSWT